MTTIADHKRKIREHLEEINDAIDYGIEKRPITLGFHASACGVELLELFLHKSDLISTGKVIKHSWFKRPRQDQKIDPLIERKLQVHFAGKDDVYNFLYSIEENRDALVYGKCTKSQIESVITAFFSLKKEIEKKLHELGESLD